MPRSYRRSAPAKLNLALRVWPAEPPGTPRAGWHRILSWMAPIDFCDEVTVFESSGPFAISRAWAADAPRKTPFDWTDESDLCYRAIRALERHTGSRLPIRLHIEKRIPVGGGLGGGSSDAAATLLACNTLFALGLSRDTLAAIGHALGSDVPFFIDDDAPPRPAIVEEFGDFVERTQLIGGEITLLIPDFGCPTREIYQSFDQMMLPAPTDTEARIVRSSARIGSIVGLRLQNDLFEPAKARVLRLEETCGGLSNVLPDRYIQLSGSGSTLFTAGRLSEPELAALRASSLPVIPVTTRLFD